MRRLLVLPLLAALLATGCSTDRNRDQQRLARLEPAVLYKRGQEALRAADYQLAADIYTALTARYPFAPEGRQARIDIIYAHYKNGERESAKDAAETFIRENPTSPRIDYVWYLKGLVDLERAPYWPERLLRVDLSARVPKTATDAYEALRTVVEDYPQSPYAADARLRLITLRNRLASYEMQISRHYAKLGAWVAAAQRANRAIELYDGAPVIADALRMLVQSYTELGYADLAENSARVFRENYPDQELTELESPRSWWKLWGDGKS